MCDPAVWFPIRGLFLSVVLMVCGCVSTAAQDRLASVGKSRTELVQLMATTDDPDVLEEIKRQLDDLDRLEDEAAAEIVANRVSMDSWLAPALAGFATLVGVGTGRATEEDRGGHVMNQPGFKTTEFWKSAGFGTAILSVATSDPEPEVRIAGLICVAVVAASYALARALSKRSK